MHRNSWIAFLLACALGPAPAAAQTPSTPPDLRGTWADEPSACSNQASDGRIAIRAREVEFFASSCKLLRVRLQSKSGWVGVFRCQESGEFWTADIEFFTPGVDPDPAKLQLRVNRDARRQLLRCATNLPVR